MEHKLVGSNSSAKELFEEQKDLQDKLAEYRANVGDNLAGMMQDKLQCQLTGLVFYNECR